MPLEGPSMEKIKGKVVDPKETKAASGQKFGTESYEAVVAVENEARL